MTTVKFKMEGSRITGFTSEGHSGFAQEGEDIVCSAVSSTIGLVECACNTVLGIAAAVAGADGDRDLIDKTHAHGASFLPKMKKER